MQDSIKMSPASLSINSAVIRGLKTSWLQSESNEESSEKSDAGAKPIAMLLHGYPDSPECWDLQFSALKKDCEIVAPWIRGAGESESTRQISRYGSTAVVLDHLEILSKVDPDSSRKVL